MDSMIEYTKQINLCADNNGYSCFMDKEHPLSHTTGRTYLHRHIASIKLGRWLQQDEHVHHIDENRKNNHPDNLLVCTQEEHNEIHKGRLVELVCPACNSIFKPTSSKQIYCSIKCSHIVQTKRPDLTKEILDELIPSSSWVQLGALFGYSDNGIKKRAKALGCTIPSRKRV